MTESAKIWFKIFNSKLKLPQFTYAFGQRERDATELLFQCCTYISISKTLSIIVQSCIFSQLIFCYYNFHILFSVISNQEDKKYMLRNSQLCYHNIFKRSFANWCLFTCIQTRFYHLIRLIYVVTYHAHLLYDYNEV